MHRAARRAATGGYIRYMTIDVFWTEDPCNGVCKVYKYADCCIPSAITVSHLRFPDVAAARGRAREPRPRAGPGVLSRTRGFAKELSNLLCAMGVLGARRVRYLGTAFAARLGARSLFHVPDRASKPRVYAHNTHFCTHMREHGCRHWHLSLFLLLSIRALAKHISPTGPIK